ncbi:Calx-beta domain-containing protein [uncultured Maribacter sp.]|uniref:Calx-beta domain-containing protein n=1 Tax=uncultured Maribacter sp. TaxID=431308 RepID=UPI00260DA552|nr:Calx-beta domain-containing protein [uncultured Maribacter sp.]
MKLKENYFFTNTINIKKSVHFSLFFIMLLYCFVGQSQQVVSIARTGAHPREVTPEPLVNGRFTVTRSIITLASLDVTIAIGGTATPTADYSPITTNVTIPAFSASTTVSLAGVVDDTDVEGNETIIISVVSNPPSYTAATGTNGSATLVIIDDDYEPTLTATDAAATEAAGVDRTGVFTVDLGRVNSTGSAIVVRATRFGTSTAVVADYTATTSNVSIANGARTGIITITPVDDAIAEGNETLSYRIRAGTGYGLGAAASITAAMTIADNDTAGVNVSAISGNTTEAGGTATFRVTLDSQPTAAVNVALSSSDTTEGTVPTTVNIPVANWDTGVLVTVTGVDDVLVDGLQNYNIITGNVTSADANYNALNGAAVTDVPVTNEDDDVYTATLTATDATATEAAEVGRDGVFTVDLGRVNTTGNPIEVNFQILPSSTSTGADYASIGTSVSIPNGDQTGVITINPTNDAIFEGSETVVLRIIGGVNYESAVPASARTATVTIQDDDTATLTIEDVTVNEDVVGGNLVFTVTLDNAVDGGTTVSYTFLNGTATGGGVDYTGVANTVTFAGTASETETIEVPIVDDTELEESETFTIRLNGATNGVLIGGGGTATGTIGDDDNCAPTPLLSPDAPSAEFCGDIQANLNDYTDSAPPAGMVLTWSQSSNPLNAGARLTAAESQNVTVQGSFFGYFYDSANDCAGGVLEIELISNDIPTIISTAGETKCDSDSGLITATPSDGASIRWFDRPTGGTQIGAGSSFVTPIVDESTFFYAEAIANGCPSIERIAVEVTILETPSSGTASNTTACNLNSTQQPLSLIDLDTRLIGDVDEGEWTFVSGPSTLEINQDNEVNFLEEAVGEYVFRYTTTGAQAPCANSSTDVTITVVSDCTPDPIDLEVLKTLDNPNAIIGENVIFTITVSNVSTNEAKNITIGDVLESGFLFVSSEASIGMYDDVSGNWIFENLEASATATLTIEATVVAGGVYSNTAELLESFPLDNNLANDTATVSLELEIPEGTDLEITKTALSSRPLVGDEVVFTVTVKNNSQEGESVSQIRISEEIDLENFVLAGEPISEPGSTYDINTGVWTIPTLARGEEAVLTITVTVPNEGVFTNTASLLSSFPADSNAENNDSVAEVMVSVPTPAEEGFLFNQFSPNGDGTNDVLKFQDTDVLPDFSNVSITIFDRYGNAVVEKNNFTDTIIWDGLYEGKQSPAGTYFYVLNLVDEDGVEVKKGWIQLIR